MALVTLSGKDTLRDGSTVSAVGRIVADPWICLRPVGSAAARRLPIFVDNAREMDDAFGHRPLYDKPTFGQLGGRWWILRRGGRPTLEPANSRMPRDPEYRPMERATISEP